MGLCISSFYTGDFGGEQFKHSTLIDRRLKDDEKRMAKEVKILLLGAGESAFFISSYLSISPHSLPPFSVIIFIFLILLVIIYFSLPPQIW